MPEGRQHPKHCTLLQWLRAKASRSSLPLCILESIVAFEDMGDKWMDIFKVVGVVHTVVSVYWPKMLVIVMPLFPSAQVPSSPVLWFAPKAETHLAKLSPAQGQTHVRTEAEFNFTSGLYLSSLSCSYTKGWGFTLNVRTPSSSDPHYHKNAAEDGMGNEGGDGQELMSIVRERHSLKDFDNVLLSKKCFYLCSNMYASLKVC